MNSKEKEIELIEVQFGKIRDQKRKTDSLSTSLFLSSAVLFITSDYNSLIKLSMLGVEVKSIYAIYFLYIASLMMGNKWGILDIRETLLLSRYKKLLVEVYDEIPKSLALMVSSDVKLRQSLFLGVGKKLDFALAGMIGFPMVLGYIIVGYKLLVIAGQSEITKAAGFFIAVLGLNFFVLLTKSSSIDKNSNRDKYHGVEG